MPLSNAAMVVMADALRSAITHLQLHSADPGAGGTSYPSGSRKAVTWSAATNNGDFGLADTVAFTGLIANSGVSWASAWSAASSGTWYGNFQLTGDTNANANGEYNLTALNIDGSNT